MEPRPTAGCDTACATIRRSPSARTHAQPLERSREPRMDGHGVAGHRGPRVRDRLHGRRRNGRSPAGHAAAGLGPAHGPHAGRGRRRARRGAPAGSVARDRRPAPAAPAPPCRRSRPGSGGRARRDPRPRPAAVAAELESDAARAGACACASGAPRGTCAACAEARAGHRARADSRADLRLLRRGVRLPRLSRVPAPRRPRSPDQPTA
jgi:hypothetical protein